MFSVQRTFVTEAFRLLGAKRQAIGLWNIAAIGA